jgi:hypothetical protein
MLRSPAKMKTPLSNEVAIGSEGRCEETCPINNFREGTNTPTMDFDDWAEDPFTLAKENDVFSSFTDVDEEVVNAHSNTSPAPFPQSSSDLVSEKNSRAAADDESDANNTANSQSRKRSLSQQSSQKETNCSTGVNLKSTLSVKKKSDYIPISRRKKKPKGMPKRPLSAYNLYFQAERTKIIANQQEGNGPRIGFEGLGKIIGKQWRDLSSADKKDYEKLAEKDSLRYRKEMDTYHEMKAKRFAEEDRRAEEQTPVLSRIASSTNSARASFDANFMKQQGSLQMVPIGEAFGNSILLTHPPKSMVSAISSLPPGTASISYRPIHIEQPSSPPRHGLQHRNILDALNSRSNIGAVQDASPPLYFSQPAGARRSELPRYDGVALGPDAATVVGAPRNNNCPMPPGMEVVLSDRNGIDRKYRVQYTCYSMTRQNANKYIESLTGANSNAIAPRSRPPASGPNREYDEWGM